VEHIARAGGSLARMRYLTYRPDIDGLRAIAVAIVVAFHTGVPGFSGGFVGVDVFFVISGFLITGLLLDELRATGSISLSRFYARRVRRLLPALALVLISTLLLGSVVLLSVAGEQQDLAKSALAAALSGSNIFFWLSSNYFSVQADLMPLLHTWSLSVEEQYYLVWPTLLIALLLLARKNWGTFMKLLLTALLLVGIATFAASVRATTTDPTAAFFLMPMRAWEFALGGALMLGSPLIERWPTFARALLFVVGIVLIGIATVMLDNTVAYPGTAVLVPTLGTGALIAAGCGPAFAPLQGWMASRGMVAVGQLSYSWYLWHWPLLSLARTHDLGERYLARDGAIALISLGLAWLTYHFIEHPIRSQQYRGFRGTRTTLLSGAAMSAVVLCCALGLGFAAKYFYAHPTDRQQKLTAQAVFDRPSATATCLAKMHSKFAGLAHDRSCFTQPSQPVELVLWGDSHANHWFPLMRKASLELHMNVEEFARASCPPLLGVMPFDEGAVDHQCEHFNRAVIAEIERLASTGQLKGVLLAGRWPAYLGRPSPDGSLLARLSYGDGPLDSARSEQALQSGLNATLQRLERAGLRVVVVGATPEFHYSVPQCLLRRSMQECAMPRAAVDARRGRAMTVVALTVASNGGAHMFDPLRFLCDEAFCYPTHGQTVMFSDPQHLTAAGSPLLEPEIDNDLRWLLHDESRAL
jgi:peptidoglycan/LPS O-acetylase OafA/YrhL